MNTRTHEQSKELLHLWLNACRDSEKVLPSPEFGNMLGYSDDELRDLYKREIRGD